MNEPPSDAASRAEVDPRREMWRRGSYETVGDWLAPASRSVLDRITEVTGTELTGQRLLDVATGTGTVAIEAARRGADVVGVDLTPELLDVARRRARHQQVEVRFDVVDFDRLDDGVADADFDVITSAFGVIFAPDPGATLRQLERRLRAGGHTGVVGWDPAGVFVVPESLLELLPEGGAMPDMSTWTTRIADLCDGSSSEVVATFVDELRIPFDSVEDAADQLERWSGGWAQLLEMFDGMGAGVDARFRLHEHLASFATSFATGIELEALYHTSVLRRVV